MSQLHIKNHYVPECYLKGWANSHKKVHVYRTLVSHSRIPVWKQYSISAVAYQKHLYTQITSGNESDDLEKWLDREFESPSTPAIEKAIANKDLSPNDWDLLIKFLAAQDVRTPTRLREHVQRTEKILSETLEETLNSLQEKLESGRTEDLKREPNIQDSIPLKITTHFEENSETGILKAETYAGRSTWIHSIKHTLDKTREVLHLHEWSIVKPAKGYCWPTSDNPVVKINYYGPDKYDLRGGWGKKKGNIIFPISPEHAMFVQIGDAPIPNGSRLSIEQTKEFIKFIVENAHRKIFSHTPEKEIPLLRPRIVNPRMLKREEEGIQEWHDINSSKEREYLASNRTMKSKL